MRGLLLVWCAAWVAGAVSAEANSSGQALDWWQNITIYQIYPRSYKDRDGDGVGDLRGIADKLEHVKDAGCGAVWLSPIYLSPMKDFGYDISNQTEIDPIFGNLDDFKALQKKCKEIGLKLILDFVPDYSSDQHVWFQKSVKKIDPYTDYYIWHDGKVDNATGKRSPPNNWVSAFKGSAWAWNEERQQYYYHVFTVQQPDLNYRNKYLVEDMKAVLRYWLDLGVDGFRVDSIPHLFEDTRFLDEPLTNRPGLQPTDYDYTEHVYTQNLPQTYDMVHQFRQVLDEYKAKDGHTQFGNHDQPRVATRFGSDRADGINALLKLLPGTAISYMGEEIAMLGTYLTWNQTVDPQGLNAGPDQYQGYSRDPERTPYQWDNTTSAGFSTNPKTWLPVNPNYKTLNLQAEIAASVSHYKVYQQLSDLRKTKTIQTGSLNVQVISEMVLAFSRELSGEDTYVVVFNLGLKDAEVDLTKHFSGFPVTAYVATASVNAGLVKGDKTSTASLELKGKASVVLSSGTVA